MNIENYLLCPLDEVVHAFKAQGFEITLVENNFNVKGDMSLVTNIQIEGNQCKITYGSFIFKVGKESGKDN